MTITELYNQLCDKDFQNHQTGNLFFPAYMFMYNPEQEYAVEKEILDIKNRLHRPNNYLDVMVLDIFEEFVYSRNPLSSASETSPNKEIDSVDSCTCCSDEVPGSIHPPFSSFASFDNFLDFLLSAQDLE